MIRSSFTFLERVGRITEQRLWNTGIRDWSDFLGAQSVRGFGNSRKCCCDQQLRKAEKNLLVGNAPYFAHILPKPEHWRLYQRFRDEAVFLDIETTGFRGDVTVVGLYNGVSAKTMVRGIDLNTRALKDELQDYKLIVTFNGSAFDLPVLERQYPGSVPYLPHMDLRSVCSRIGLAGGLKAVERRLGIARPEGIAALGGEDAVLLWHAYTSTGRREYLDRLIAYNTEDIVNLKAIADIACERLKHLTLAFWRDGPPSS